MSDIRAQSRRDAEFDRLLDRMDTPTYPWVEPLVRDAYKMGDRHRAEQCPRWVSHPDCFGSWFAVFVAPDGSWQDILRVNVKRGESVAEGPNWRYYGPIPEVKP